MNRRKLLTWAVRGTGAVVAGVVLTPALLDSLTPVLNAEEDPLWRPVGPLSDFVTGKVRKVIVHSSDSEKPDGSLKELAVFVWRKEDESFVVYSQACTDLGCPVKYDSGSEWFYCPCHGGIFDKEGNRKAGPPPRPLWRFANRVSGASLEIDLRSVPPMARGGHIR